MTPTQQEYIITEEQLQRGQEFMSKTGRKKYEKEIRSRPYTAASGREQEIRVDERGKVFDKLDAYAEECRYENERRGRSEKNEVIVAALAGAALAFEGMREEIAELRKQGASP